MTDENRYFKTDLINLLLTPKRAQAAGQAASTDCRRHWLRSACGNFTTESLDSRVTFNFAVKCGHRFSALSYSVPGCVLSELLSFVM